jgi:hypothetical protein
MLASRDPCFMMAAAHGDWCSDPHERARASDVRSLDSGGTQEGRVSVRGRQRKLPPAITKSIKCRLKSIE